MKEREYGVLHEIGDYSRPQELSKEDNKAVNEQLRREQNNNDNEE